jgi:hypothetical protein
MPDCKEKLAYNVPFITSRICYIWPATIPWEIIRKVVGFAKVIHFDETLQRQN